MCVILAWTPIITTNNNNTPINLTVAVQATIPIDNSATYIPPAPTLNMLTFFEPNHFAIADKLQVEYKTFMERPIYEQALLSDCDTRKSRQRFFSDYPHFEVERDKIYKSEDAVRAFDPFNARLAKRELINDIKSPAIIAFPPKIVSPLSTAKAHIRFGNKLL